MKFLSGLLAGIGATVAAVFFWRKHHASADVAFGQAADSVSSWSNTAAEKVGEASSDVASTAQKAADAVSDAAAQAKSAFPQ